MPAHAQAGTSVIRTIPLTIQAFEIGFCIHVCAHGHIHALRTHTKCGLAHAGSPWRAWSSSRPRYDNDTRYQFVVYTRDAPAGRPTAAAAASRRGVQIDTVGSPPVLPPGVSSQHDEYQVSKGGKGGYSQR